MSIQTVPQKSGQHGNLAQDPPAGLHVTDTAGNGCMFHVKWAALKHSLPFLSGFAAGGGEAGAEASMI